jgi:hypothetical protein
MMSAANAATPSIEFPFDLSELPESDLARQTRAVEALANFIITAVDIDEDDDDPDVDRDEVKNSELREIYAEYELHTLEGRMLTMFAREAVRQAGVVVDCQ